MNVTTTARHYDLAPALRDYAEDKVSGMKKYFDQVMHAHIIFSLEKYRHKVEITVHANKHDFVSTEESDDMYVSVDRACDKLEKQLRRYKDKIRDRRTNVSMGDAAVDFTQDSDTESDDEPNPVALAVAPMVTTPNPYEFPELDLDTAVAKLANNGKSFSIFTNTATHRLNVIFKTDDGKIAVLEAAVEI